MATTTWSDSLLSAGSILYSTNLANKVTSYQQLADRVCYDLGYPLINLEIHGQQLYTNIARAVEMFTKFAGYTEEFLVFDSNLYTRGKGLNVENLLTKTPELTATYNTKIQSTAVTTDTVATLTSYTFTESKEDIFIPLFNFNCGDVIIDPSEYTFTMVLSDTNTQVTKLLSVAVSGEVEASVTSTEYGTVFTTSTEIFDLSTNIAGNVVTIGVIPKTNKTGTVNANRNATTITDTTTQNITTTSPIIANFDDLTKQYRKVIDVYSFDESSNTSVQNLFTIEQSLAQQTYFSYAMGNYGFDLISWYILKQWLETRSKMLAIQRSFKFNERTQHINLYPEPKVGEQFYGVFGAYVEKSVRDVIVEPWVFQYALALTKITIGRIRGKFTNTQLFGGGTLDTSLLQEGLGEKKELEQMLLTGTPGFGDAAPPQFFIG
tara:strand:- start:1763 stop:3064 length:1302 start_codon:yes stop_codon:yes gene_type:complete